VEVRRVLDSVPDLLPRIEYGKSIKCESLRIPFLKLLDLLVKLFDDRISLIIVSLLFESSNLVVTRLE
jgi:hypothetical protein